MEQDFPIATYLDIKRELLTIQKALEKEKAAWSATRDFLEENTANELDMAFKTAFELIDGNYTASHLSDCLQSLEILVQQGASGRTMSSHELGRYNLAMLVEDIRYITDEDTLDIATRIIRLTIIADAAVNQQKAYVGNGGMPALDFICLYLAHGIDTAWYRLSSKQYEYIYRLFPLFAHHYSATFAQDRGYDEPYHMYVRCLQHSPAAADLQIKTFLRMLCLGWTPFYVTEEWLDRTFFLKIANLDTQWLSIIYPYDDGQLKFYIDVAQQHITAATIKVMLNAVTMNNKSRKDFKKYFSLRPHWLIKLAITKAPDIVFQLVKRNEKDLLYPFLRYYKRELATLRNEQGLSLGAYAITTRGVVENTIQLLRAANLLKVD
ncbi:hypothetical protein [Chitinophaga rhizophila]|uniref:Uncharacterized protein n=1 Tax=Chitinophaga rhizophila TaxID=2866212 RepID=A0ABS7GBZ4_9BACT|nr:hypothetical protein [Chitinophaga rhizophila]MBW8685196.1 hypothetical protein [Chitinophaga rhizophila]